MPHRELRFDDHPVTGRMVIVASSRQQADPGSPAAAFDLYAGGRVPQLRQRLGGHPAHRRRIWLLSARNALVHADQVVLSYQRALTVERALRLRDRVAAEVEVEWMFYGVPAEVLVVAGPVWMVTLGELLRLPERPRVHWFTETDEDWRHANAVLDRWGWP